MKKILLGLLMLVTTPVYATDLNNLNACSPDSGTHCDISFLSGPPLSDYFPAFRIVNDNSVNGHGRGELYNTIIDNSNTIGGTGVIDLFATKANQMTTVNGHNLSANITLVGSDIFTGSSSNCVKGDGSTGSCGSSGVTSITAGTGLSGGTITTTGTISMPSVVTPGTYSGLTVNAQGIATAGTTRSASYPSRALNSCFQISSTRDADFHYSVDVTAALVLGGGTATITSYTNSGCTTGSQVIRDGTVSGVVAGGTTSVNLDGTLIGGLWAKITTSTVGVGATVAIRAVQQEVLQ